MKSFKQYIFESPPEVFSGDVASHLGKFGRHIEDEIRTVRMMSGDRFEHIQHGLIPSETKKPSNYSLHQFIFDLLPGQSEREHSIYMVDERDKKIVGRINAMGAQRGYSRSRDPRDFKDSLKVESIDIHPRHREKKIGHSLAVGAYRLLNRVGHPIVSSSLQTFGGAKLWDRLRSDAELGGRMILHNPSEKSTTPARFLSSKLIWGATEPERIRNASEWRLNPEIDPKKIEKGGHIDSYLEILSPTESAERKQ